MGAAFAQFEIKVVLRTMLSRVQLSAPNPLPERQRSRHVTLVPEHDAEVLVNRRLAAASNADGQRLSVRA